LLLLAVGKHITALAATQTVVSAAPTKPCCIQLLLLPLRLRAYNQLLLLLLLLQLPLQVDN
jgi:hypothetical protein